MPPAAAPPPVAVMADAPTEPAHQSWQELEALLETLRGQSYFEALGVPETASATEVDRAYEARARAFHPDRFRFQAEGERQLAQEIFDRLRDAQTTLRDAARRKRYVTKLARERAEEVVSASPSPAAENVYYMGVEHLRGRRYQEAARAFSQALALAPGQASYHGALGWALFRAAPADPGAVEAGMNELRRAVELNARDPWVRISLGRFYAETGWPDHAIAEFEAALELNPALTDVEEEIRRLRADG
jgi:tetratricopeptide (TPR) repeat protein